MASVVAFTSGRHVNRFGHKAFASFGIALFGLSCLWWLLRIGQAPDYAGEMLPGLLAGGIGVGFVLPSLASAAAASVPRERFATGSAIYTMTRQLGFVLGVSILVAVMGTPSRADPVAAFDRGWNFMVIASALGVAAALFIGSVQHPAPAAQAGETDQRPVDLACALPGYPEASGHAVGAVQLGV
jgi:MFS family permease